MIVKVVVVVGLANWSSERRWSSRFGLNLGSRTIGVDGSMGEWRLCKGSF